jgi:hypothetical protein
MKTLLLHIALACTVFTSCGNDPGLYDQEKITFEASSASSELDLSEEESSDFFGDYYGFFGVPLPAWPVFDYYQFPLPVYVPINPVANLIEWIHPMYIGLYLSGNFGPREDL